MEKKLDGLSVQVDSQSSYDVAKALFGDDLVKIENEKQVDIKKMPKQFLTFTESYFRRDYRKILKNSFRRPVSGKKRIMGKKFIETYEYGKPQYIYDTENKYYKELMNLEIDSPNWYYEISSKLKNLVFNLDKILSQPSGISNEFYNSRIEMVLEWAQVQCRYDLMNDDESSLTSEAIMQYCINGKQLPIYSNELKYQKVYEYAMESDATLLCETGLTDDAFERFIMNNEMIPLTNNEKIRKSLNASIKQIKDLLCSNTHHLTKFLTLTFAPIEKKQLHLNRNNGREHGEVDLQFKYVNDATSYEECVNAMTEFRNLLKKNIEYYNTQQSKKNVDFEKIDFRNIGVPEYHTNGSIHYHFLIREIPDKFLYEIPYWLDYDFQKGSRRYDLGVKTWKYGKSSLEDIGDPHRIVTYLLKYLLKSLQH